MSDTVGTPNVLMFHLRHQNQKNSHYYAKCGQVGIKFLATASAPIVNSMRIDKNRSAQ